MPPVPPTPLVLVPLCAALAVLGTVLAGALPRPWRTTVRLGSVLTGILLVAFPTLTRLASTDPAHGYPTGLIVGVAVLWWFLLGGTVTRIARDRRRGHPGPPPQLSGAPRREGPTGPTVDG